MGYSHKTILNRNYSSENLEYRRQSQFQRGDDESAEDAEDEKRKAAFEIKTELLQFTSASPARSCLLRVGNCYAS